SWRIAALRPRDPDAPCPEIDSARTIIIAANRPSAGTLWTNRHALETKDMAVAATREGQTLVIGQPGAPRFARGAQVVRAGRQAAARRSRNRSARLCSPAGAALRAKAHASRVNVSAPSIRPKSRHAMA